MRVLEWCCYWQILRLIKLFSKAGVGINSHISKTRQILLISQKKPFHKRKVSTMVNQMVPKATGDARHQWVWVQECRLTSRTVQPARALNLLFKFSRRREGKGKGSGAVSTLRARGRVRDLEVGIFRRRGARLRGGEGDDRGWDGWMAWLNQWTWDWTNSQR